MFKLLKILIFCRKESLKQLKMKQKKQKEGFFSMLLGTLGPSLLGNLLSRKGIVRAGSGRCSLNSSYSCGHNKGKGIVRAGYGNKWDF